MRDVACDLCGAADAEPRMRKDRWTIVRCRRCRLVYLNPRPGPEVIARDYDWFRHGLPQSRKRRRRESPLRRLARIARRKGLRRGRSRERVVLRRIRKLVSGGRLLDVGCGEGEMVEAARDAGFDACGLDISDAAVAAAHREGRTAVRKDTVHDAPFPERHFDAILMMSYLEHEPYPTAAVRKARALLREGGHLFVKVPHYGSWNRMVLGAGWSGYFFPQHLFYFTPKTIRRLFEACGLEVVRNGFWDHVPVSDVLWATARRPLA